MLILFRFLPVATATEKSPLSPMTRQNAVHRGLATASDVIISIPTLEPSGLPQTTPVNKEVPAQLRCSQNHPHPLKCLLKRSSKTTAGVLSACCRCLFRREAPRVGPASRCWPGRVVRVGTDQTSEAAQQPRSFRAQQPRGASHQRSSRQARNQHACPASGLLLCQKHHAVASCGLSCAFKRGGWGPLWIGPCPLCCKIFPFLPAQLGEQGRKTQGQKQISPKQSHTSPHFYGELKQTKKKFVCGVVVKRRKKAGITVQTALSDSESRRLGFAAFIPRCVWPTTKAICPGPRHLEFFKRSSACK